MWAGAGADGGEPSRRSGPRSRLDGLGVLEARLAQVHVHIDEAGRDDETGGVEHFRSGGVKICAQCRDLSIVNGHVGNSVVLRRRVDHTAVLDDEPSHYAAPPSKTRSSTAIRTAMPFST